MTSNQLQYWRNQEEKRANVAKESETKRHNLTQEQLTDLELKLKDKGIELQKTEDLLKLWDMYAKYSDFDLNAMPVDAQRTITEALGYKTSLRGDDRSTRDKAMSTWDEIKRVVGGILKSKMLGGLF